MSVVDRRVARFVAVLAVLGATLIACSSSPRSGGDDAPSLPPSREPTPSPPSTPLAGDSCGALPRSSGPLAGLARVELRAPAVARAGSRITVRATVSFSRSAARAISVPRSSALLVLDGDRVVARTRGASSAAEIPLIATAGASRPAQALPSSVDLTACGGGGPLPAGSYRLAAVLGYRLDSLNSGVDGPTRAFPTGQLFALVSEPVSLRVE